MQIRKNFNGRKWVWLAVFFLAVAIIKLLGTNQFHVEKYYTGDFYLFFSMVLRILFGWIPFSVGDLLYLLAGCWLLWKLIKNVRLFFKRELDRQKCKKGLIQLAVILATVYIIFNVFWGLNYNRKGINWQLHLSSQEYNDSDLKSIAVLLLQKVNATKRILVRENLGYPPDKELFVRARACYHVAAIGYPFICYRGLSVKSSLYGRLGDYLGFTGYYDPFTGEAQVNTTVPKFLLPYITLHEMGHQLGYAKEDEANFSGYLAAANSTDTLFQYSAYLDLFTYANREIFYVDSVAAKALAAQLIPEVKADLQEWRRFNMKYTSFFEPLISWLYGKYLMANQQPKGLRSYNEVVATLIAYYKKYGKI